MLLTLTLDPADATADGVRRVLGLDERALDPDFGVVAVDPDNHRYAVMVDEDAAERVAGTRGVEGPFANPRIEPFGPPSD